MKSAAKTIILAAGCILALAALGSCSRKQDPPSAPSSSTLPADLTGALQKSGFAVAAKPFVPDDFALNALDGSRLSLSSFKGKVVFLSFWATWCGPCKEELPSIQALYQKLSAKGLVVLAVDLGEGKAKVEQFVKANHLTFPVLLDGDAAVGSSYGASSIPTNYLIDRSGRIIARVVGFDGVEWTTSQRVDLFDKILGM